MYNFVGLKCVYVLRVLRKKRKNETKIYIYEVINLKEFDVVSCSDNE